MKKLFKEMIREFHQSELPQPSYRELTLPQLPEGVRKTFVFMGMRRSGKTWAVYQIMRNLLNAGLDITRMLYINFEDERLSDMEKRNFKDIVEAYFELYPAYLHTSDVYFFFDEIHEIDGWEKFIRRLLDQSKMRIFLTGSSAKLLSIEIGSSLRGRTLTLEIFPFNFSEYLNKLGIPFEEHLSTSQRIELMHHLNNFLHWGGFPETIGALPAVHRLLLQEYTSSVIYRDIIDRYGVTNIHALKQLLAHALRNSATVFSITKIHNTMKSMGIEVGKATLYEYMNYFEDAYCVFSLNKYDLSHRKSTVSMKKIFAVDQGLVSAFSMSSAFDLSAQLETAVFAHLRRQTPNVYYYKTSDNKEVDFVIVLPDQAIHLYQVCVTLKDRNTYRREVDGLSRAMQELHINQGTIVTLEEEETIEGSAGTISVVPALTFFLKKAE